MVLSQKETTLLQDIQAQEQLCVEKYKKSSAAAHDGQLKDLFSSIQKEEQQHYETITQILNGTVPTLPNESGQSRVYEKSDFSSTYDTLDSSKEKQEDKYLCSDCLGEEKHVSSVYNTSIFEFKDTKLRDALNHIQKEEQEHGEDIYNYMSQNGMYN